MSQLSLAIPHFNRFHLLCECVANVIGDRRIAEVVISDDCSDPNIFAQIKDYFADMEKVKVFRNASNLDCYQNKFRAVQLATQPWVVLFDDDNVMKRDYLDTLFALPTWHPDVVYCPEFAAPHFDYRTFSGRTVDRSNVARFMVEKHFTTMLNTANYFFNRSSWLGVFDGSVDPHTADSIYQAYRLLNAGKKLYITPGLQYFHRVHDGSHYKRENHKTGKFASEVETKLKSLK